ncbi:hypothetical protein E2320_003332 [Naja naja]|nr:hypothetical protein E2320_003332 [Naja naja]
MDSETFTKRFHFPRPPFDLPLASSGWVGPPPPATILAENEGCCHEVHLEEACFGNIALNFLAIATLTILWTHKPDLSGRWQPSVHLFGSRHGKKTLLLKAAFTYSSIQSGPEFP